MTPIVTIERHLMSASPLGWWGGVSLLVVILTISLGLLRREIAARRRPMRSALLIGLRLAVVVLLGLLVLQPVFVVRREERRAGKVVIAADRSRSMLRDDALEGTELLNLADTLGVVGLSERERGPIVLARELRRLDADSVKWKRVVVQVGEDRQQGWPSSPAALAGLKSLGVDATASAAKIAALSAKLGAVEKIIETEKPAVGDAAGSSKGADTKPSVLLSLGKVMDLPSAIREAVEKSTDAGALADAEKFQAAVAAWDSMNTMARESVVELERVQAWLDRRFLDKIEAPARAELDGLAKSSRFEIAKRLAGAVSRDPSVSARHEIELLGFDALTGTTAASDTDLFAAMEQALSSAERGTITSLVLLTDGGQNVPDRPALAARLSGRSVTLFGVPVGAAREQPDVAVSEVVTPRVVLKGKTFDTDIVLKTSLPAGTDVEVTATDGDKPLASTTLKTDGQPTARVRLAIRAAERFTESVRIKASIAGGDALPANDAATVGIEVLDRASRILVVGEQPTWDLTALMRACTKLPSRIDSVFWKKVVEKGSDQENSRGRIPGTAAGFKRYDVIVLNGAIFPGMTEADGKLLLEWVTKEGGRLVVVGAASEYWSRLPGAAGNATGNKDTAAADDIVTLAPTAEGARLPIVSLASDPSWSKGLWSGLLPPHRVGAAPAQRIVALACGDKPVLTVGLRGRGRVYALTIDDLFRSREWAPEGLADLFWQRLAEDVMSPGVSGVSPVGVYPAHPLAGGAAWVMTLAKEKSKGVMKDASGAESALTFDDAGGDDDAGHVWIAKVVAGGGVVRVDGQAEVGVQVTSPIYREDLAARLDEESLSRVVGYARGEIVRPASLVERLSAMEPREDRRVSVTEHRLWNAWGLLLVLAVVMTTEWVVRRRSGFAL